MSFLKRLFKNTDSQPAVPEVRFGRYSDSYKETENYKAWDQSVEAFEEKQYLDSLRAFLRYLRDEHQDNVHWQDHGDRIEFEICQGSKLISGLADALHFKAESKVAKAKDLDVAFMRRLVEQNFDNLYSRYALDPDNNITVVFDTFTLDGSPYKIYHALKEMATHADKQDDLLLDEFDSLEPISSPALMPVPDAEKQTKYDYICREIDAALRVMEDGRLDKNQYPGGVGYLLLCLVYKLDYLTQPQGFMMETLERAHRLYFTNDGKTTAQKNLALAKELQTLRQRSQTLFYKEMYRASATFGITSPVNHRHIAGFIESELPNMDWYCENGHTEVALSVPGYIAGYCLFNYAPPRPVKDLLHLYFQITEAGFFKHLGFPAAMFEPETGVFHKKTIRQAIEGIVEKNRERFHLQPDLSLLQWNDLPTFARSLLAMLARMEVETRV